MQLTLCAVLFGAAFAAMSPSPRPSSSPSYSAVAPLATDIGGINLSVKENACKLDATYSPADKGCCPIKFLPHGSVSHSKSTCSTTIVDTVPCPDSFETDEDKAAYAADLLANYEALAAASDGDRIIIHCGTRKYNYVSKNV